MAGSCIGQRSAQCRWCRRGPLCAGCDFRSRIADQGDRHDHGDHATGRDRSAQAGFAGRRILAGVRLCWEECNHHPSVDYPHIRPPPRSRSSLHWSGEAGALAEIAADHPIRPPGTRFIYSDLNFIVLGELVHRVSKEPLDVYAERHIFTPLHMTDTSFVRRSPNMRGSCQRIGKMAGYAGVRCRTDRISHGRRRWSRRGFLDR